MKAKRLSSLIFGLGLLSSLNAAAQLKEFPLSSASESKALSRLRADSVYTPFPFWEDFSSSGQQADSSRWLNSENVYISADIGLQPPTYKAASLNGEDAFGYPYSEDPYTFGPTDHLTSQLIDLSAFSSEDDLYISFFWQLQGLGERPDEEDRLELQFKDRDQAWHTVWMKEGENSVTTDFQQITPLKIEGEEFFHDNFQFRFQAYGRLAGKVDNWNLDYIYLDRNRSTADTTYLDRALSTPPASIFNDYYAIPAAHFFLQPDFYLTNTEAEFFNLDPNIQPLTYNAVITQADSSSAIDTLNLNTAIQPIPRGLERRTLNINAPMADKIPEETDTSGYYIEQRLELSLFLNRSGDTLLSNPDGGYYQHIDFRANDTLRSVYSLENYYAYDDGTAEKTSGVNQKNGRLAYEYSVAEGAYLSHIDIYFPQTGISSEGVPIELMVWSSLEGEEVRPLFSQNVTVKSAGLNQLHSYKLSRPVWVEGTYYIGYRQTVDEFLLVGLDKNTDTGDKIYYKTTGNWTQNEKVRGSLMMRPRFQQDAEDLTLGTEDNFGRQLKVFPNPSDGVFYYNGKFSVMKIFNSQGKLIRQYQSRTGESKQLIDLSDQPEGIYMVWVGTAKGVSTQRIFLDKR